MRRPGLSAWGVLLGLLLASAAGAVPTRRFALAAGNDEGARAPGRCASRGRMPGRC
ncbi:hypothetical protein ACN28S_35445 [Cystobacter fuscus]